MYFIFRILILSCIVSTGGANVTETTVTTSGLPHGARFNTAELEVSKESTKQEASKESTRLEALINEANDTNKDSEQQTREVLMGNKTEFEFDSDSHGYPAQNPTLLIDFSELPATMIEGQTMKARCKAYVGTNGVLMWLLEHRGEKEVIAEGDPRIANVTFGFTSDNGPFVVSTFMMTMMKNHHRMQLSCYSYNITETAKCEETLPFYCDKSPVIEVRENTTKLASDKEGIDPHKKYLGVGISLAILILFVSVPWCFVGGQKEFIERRSKPRRTKQYSYGDDENYYEEDEYWEDDANGDDDSDDSSSSGETDTDSKTKSRKRKGGSSDDKHPPRKKARVETSKSQGRAGFKRQARRAMNH